MNGIKKLLAGNNFVAIMLDDKSMDFHLPGPFKIIFKPLQVPGQ